MPTAKAKAYVPLHQLRRMDLLKGVGLLGTIVSCTLFVGKTWGEQQAVNAQRPVLMDRRDREEDKMADDLKEIHAELRDLRMFLLQHPPGPLSPIVIKKEEPTP